MIITGAPIEHLEFEEVDYWEELKEIMDWAVHHVTSTMFICWGAQAGYIIIIRCPSIRFRKKMFGVFNHIVNNPKDTAGKRI